MPSRCSCILLHNPSRTLLLKKNYKISIIGCVFGANWGAQTEWKILCYFGDTLNNDYKIIRAYCLSKIYLIIKILENYVKWTPWVTPIELSIGQIRQ